MSSAVVGHAVHALGWPHWACEGTPYSAEGRLPPLIPVAHAMRIADNLARRVPDPYLHFRVNRATAPALDASLALALLHAPTLADGLRLAVAHANAVVPLLEFAVVATAATLEYVVRPRVALGACVRAAVECHLDLLYRYVEARRGFDLRDAAIEFAHPPAGHAGDYRAWLGCGIRFGAGRNALVLPSAWGGLQAPGADSGLWLLARDRVLADIAAVQEPAKVRDVRRRIATRLVPGQAPRLKQVAADCGVSTRTLIRSLRLAGTTFHEVVDDERRARAMTLILRPSIPLAQLAHDLGFPDRSSFGRRFRAWFGDTPARFRRHGGLPAAAGRGS